MFENLSEKLQRAFKSLRGQAVLSPENMEEALREIRLALLEADVNFKVVKQLIDHIQEKAIGQEVATALSPGDQVIKILRAHGGIARIRQNHHLGQVGKLAEEWRPPSLAGFC